MSLSSDLQTKNKNLSKNFNNSHTVDYLYYVQSSHLLAQNSKKMW